MRQAGPFGWTSSRGAVYIPSITNFVQEITDSKRLSPRNADLRTEILGACYVGTGVVSSAEIDELNILQATFLAMRRAIRILPIRPDLCLVDGQLKIPELVAPEGHC